MKRTAASTESRRVSTRKAKRFTVMRSICGMPLPNATFVAFTGTPTSSKDKDPRGVFGDYVDIYDIEQAVKDKATVPIYYESRLVKLQFAEDVVATLDEEIEAHRDCNRTATCRARVHGEPWQGTSDHPGCRDAGEASRGDGSRAGDVA